MTGIRRTPRPFQLPTIILSFFSRAPGVSMDGISTIVQVKAAIPAKAGGHGRWTKRETEMAHVSGMSSTDFGVIKRAITAPSGVQSRIAFLPGFCLG
jgi:hypothetical protein